MQLARPGIAIDPRRFGRGAARSRTAARPMPASGGDLKLFASTFAAGFLFVTVLIA